MQQDRGARRNIERLDETSARDGDDRIAGGKRRDRQAMLLVAEHQGQWLLGLQQSIERLALPGGGADHARASSQLLQRVRKADATVELDMFQATLGDAIARIRRSCL